VHFDTKTPVLTSELYHPLSKCVQG